MLEKFFFTAVTLQNKKPKSRPGWIDQLSEKPGKLRIGCIKNRIEQKHALNTLEDIRKRIQNVHRCNRVPYRIEFTMRLLPRLVPHILYISIKCTGCFSVLLVYCVWFIRFQFQELKIYDKNKISKEVPACRSKNAIFYFSTYLQSKLALW